MKIIKSLDDKEARKLAESLRKAREDARWLLDLNLNPPTNEEVSDEKHSKFKR
jgi:hypothetical protein